MTWMLRIGWMLVGAGAAIAGLTIAAYFRARRIERQQVRARPISRVRSRVRIVCGDCERAELGACDRHIRAWRA